jgi:hypothetical protein
MNQLCYLAFFRIRWDSNPRYLKNTIVFKTTALNHSTTYPKANKGIRTLIFNLGKVTLYQLSYTCSYRNGNLNEFKIKINSSLVFVVVTIVISKFGKELNR